MREDLLDLADRSLLVTGASGFLGRHVVGRLRAHGASEIHAVSSVDCDLREPRAVAKLFRRTEPSVVVHLAAVLGGVAWQQKNQATAFLDNARMMEALVRASIDAGVERFLFAASSLCYPAGAPMPFREESLWEGAPEPSQSGYAQAKRAGIALLEAAHDQHGLAAGVVMPANMYGPGARFDRERGNVVAATILRCVEARDRGAPSITCWGTGTPLREFLYVEDAADGVVRAVRRLTTPEPVNLGTGVEISIAELVETTCRAVGFEGEVLWDSERPDGAPRVCMDVTRMRETLDWTPPTSLHDGLRRTIDWWESTGASTAAG